LPNFAKDFGLQKKAFCFILFCVRKFSLWYFLLFGCLFVSVARESKAQGTLDSLTIPAISGAPVIGYYVSGGVGWSFVPTSDILVTGIEASATQFSFWQGSNQVLATFNVSSPNTKPPNSFAPIAPLFLSAGELYFVSCQNSNFSVVVVSLFGDFKEHTAFRHSALRLTSVSSPVTESRQIGNGHPRSLHLTVTRTFCFTARTSNSKSCLSQAP
jgi:hypothetical protein